MSYTDLEVEGGSDYLKLTSGSVVSFHILSQTPDKAVIHWQERKKITCPRVSCDLCESGDRPKVRWTADVWDRKDKKVKKFEFGTMIATQLKAIAELLAESSQTIHDVDIRVKTTGAGLETEYSVLHIPISGEIPQDVSERYSLPF